MCEISEALQALEKQFKEDVSQNKTRQKETFGAILSEVQTKFEAMQTESQSHFDQMRDEYFRKVQSVHDQIVAHQKQSETQIQADQAQWDQKLKTTQAEMEAVTQQIAEAKQKWADEQKQIQARTLDQSEIVSLNVGGQKGIQVSRALLTQEPETVLEAMFSGRHPLKEIDGEVFLDRDPKIFGELLPYLRNGRQTPAFDSKSMADQFQVELKYWGLDQ